MKNFIQRLKEPSTWAGFAALAVLCGLDPAKVAAAKQVAAAVAPFVDPGTVANVVTSVAAGLAVLLPESKKAGDDEAGE